MLYETDLTFWSLFDTMIKRRLFIQNVTALSAGVILKPYYSLGTITSPAPEFTSNRPPEEKRRFKSPAVENKISEVKNKLKDTELAWMFENCFPNTLDTTVTVGELNGKPDTYVITGDIDAMWLRDSSAQVWPYLPLMTQDKALEKMIMGVINRHAACIMIDPYANAFYKDAKTISPHHDLTDMKPGVHERKWEIDSLCYVIRLAHGYWKSGGDTTCFDADWLKAMHLIVDTFKQQQRKTDVGPYRFQRSTTRPTDTAAGSGYGNLAKPNGLICSVFRPSDDSTVFPYLIPSNYFAVTALRQLSAMVTALYKDQAFATDCQALADEVHQALISHATVNHKTFGEILSYEIDGYGSSYVADDANIPSLLSLPYLNTLSTKDLLLYHNTRKFLLSYGDNPYFVRGKAAEGISGPHAGRDNIWPMGIMMRAITSANDNEIIQCIHYLKTTHAGTGFMHESFNKDDANKYTRKWFAWANTLFGEFIINLINEKPHLLARV